MSASQFKWNTGASNSKAQSVFYAMLQSISDPVNYRAILMFASRDAADRWWRSVQDVQASDNQNIFVAIWRNSPQFYTYDHTKITQAQMTTKSGIKDPNMIKALNELVLLAVSSTYYNANIIPPQPIVDRISGNFFYIRSTLDTSLFWYAPQDGHIHASKTERSKFRISIADNSRRLSDNDGKMMVGTDDVYIMLAAAQDSNYVILDNQNSRLLTGGKRDAKIPLGSLEGDYILFSTLASSGDGGNSDSENGMSLRSVEGYGDVWELC